MIEKHGLFECRACRPLGLSRDCYRGPPQTTLENAQLSAAIIDRSQARRYFGYRLIHNLLRPVFPGINHKRVYRIYSEADLAVRKGRRTKRSL